MHVILDMFVALLQSQQLTLWRRCCDVQESVMELYVIFL